jgi:hypothetical protein
VNQHRLRERYVMYSFSAKLPTKLMEAGLDFFCGRMSDLATAEPGSLVACSSTSNLLFVDALTNTPGKPDLKWRPAKGVRDDPRRRKSLET